MVFLLVSVSSYCALCSFPPIYTFNGGHRFFSRFYCYVIIVSSKNRRVQLFVEIGILSRVPKPKISKKRLKVQIKTMRYHIKRPKPTHYVNWNDRIRVPCVSDDFQINKMCYK